MSFITPILETQYVGDSLSTITSNYNNLNAALCNVNDFLKKVDDAFSTRTVGITSLDNSVKFSARFVEAYSSVTEDAKIQFSYLYGIRNANEPILRKLNTAEYNCDSNGNFTSSSNGFYKLNTDGTITVPAGVYFVDSECSAFWTNSHVTNLINADTGAVLLYGSAEFSAMEGRPTTTTYSKMHGRLIFSTPTRIRLKQYIQSYQEISGGATGLGWTFWHAGFWPGYDRNTPNPTTPLLYWAFINIQKIQDYTP